MVYFSFENASLIFLLLYLYRDLQHDALQYLRSEICNNLGLSVLQYASFLSLTDCVQVMITENDIFVKQRDDGKKLAMDQESGKVYFSMPP